MVTKAKHGQNSSGRRRILDSESILPGEAPADPGAAQPAWGLASLWPEHRRKEKHWVWP